MSRAISDGHIPPQWSKNFGYGYGMPLFLFYAPLPYYFGALVYWLGGSLIFSVSSLFLVANLATIFGAYYLGKRLFDSLGGVLLSAAITLAPYRAVNLYIRGAISETWGIAASIWMLLGLVLVVQKKQYGWLVLSLSTAGLLLSHNLITLIFLPFFAIFAATLILYQKAWRQAVTILWSSLLGVAMSMFYILPAFFEKSATQVEGRILTQYFDFHLHFLYLRQFITPYWGYGGSVWGPQDDISFFLGYGMLTGLLIVLFYFIRNWRTHKNNKSLSLMLFGLSLALAVGATLATTEKTLFLWESVDLLRFVQFPWRFLSVAILFFSVAIASGVASITSRWTRLAVFGVLFVLFLSNGRYFQPESYLDNPEALYSAEESQVVEVMSGVLPDFIPQGFDEDSVPAIAGAVTLEPNLPASSVLVNRVQEKLIFVEFTTEQKVVFALADFPGWQVAIDGEQVDHESTPEGLVRVLVPAGSHQIGLRFLPTPIRVWANSISVASLAVLFALLLRQERKR